MDAFGRLALVGIFLPACATPADDGACRTERDCDADWLCRDGRCRPATHCMADGDCASPDICHESRCRPRGCTDDADCGPARFCRAGRCAPLPDNACATDTDCPSGACEPTTRLCRPVVCDAGCAPAGCTVDADCPSTEWCAPEGRCQPGCRLVREACPAPQVCDPVSRACVRDGCVQDEDCPPGTWCAGGPCLPGCRPTPDDCARGVCDPEGHACLCLGDADCPDDRFCAADGDCRPGCRLQRGACPDGPCDPVTRTCAPQPCAIDTDCPHGAVCGVQSTPDGLTRLCLLGDRAHRARPCLVDADCATALCVEGRVCFAACADDGDCDGALCTAVRVGDPPVVLPTCLPP